VFPKAEIEKYKQSDKEDDADLEPKRMCAWQALLVRGFRRVSQTVSNRNEEALFGIMRAGFPQVRAHFRLADVALVSHG
jgi:hypothetical protein